jgi:RNA polymerase sigma factor (sigma-70 family)
MFLKLRKNISNTNPATEIPDELLVSQYIESGDKELVAELFERYTHLVFGICLNYLHDPDQSKDAVMEIFESLFQKLTTHKIIHFRNWLYTVARNYCLMQFRKSGVLNRLKDNIRSETSDAESPEYLLDDELFNVNKNIVISAVQQLNPEQETCIKLMYLDEKSYKDISTITGLSLNEVKSHIQNGKRNLRNILINLKDDPEK